MFIDNASYPKWIKSSSEEIAEIDHKRGTYNHVVAVTVRVVFLVLGFLFLLAGCGDGNGTRTITVIPVNDAPALTAQSIVTSSGIPETTTISVNDPDVGQAHTFVITTAPTNGTATVDADGVITYISDTGFIGSDRLVVTVTDDGTPPLSSTVTIEISVTGPNNDAPAPTAQSIVTSSGIPETTTISVNDPDVGQAHTFVITTAPTNGTATVDADGVITYISDTGFIGSDRLVVTVTDDGTPPLSSTVTIEISVTGPNIVMILTDDQRWDTLWAMPIVQEKLVTRGVLFTNAFVTTPLCCPVRASILSGGFYAHNTGVLYNTLPNGGVQKFQDTETLATILQDAGYKTALVGKYMNEYVDIAPYIPPGWTKFVADAKFRNWFDFSVAVGGSGKEPSKGELLSITQYITDFHKEQALDFLDQYGDGPFFLYLSTDAPHSPATPAPGDEQLFSDVIYRGRAYGEEDLSDKPPWVSSQAAEFSVIFTSLEEEDEFHRDQLRSLQAVDRAVGAIVDRVEAQGKLAHTIFIFTSDNGYLWGEHGLFLKGRPYEESIRVPFVIVVPGITPRIDEHLIAVDLDIGPTLFELAGLSKETDGLSLLPLLRDQNALWREEFLIQYFGPNVSGIWSGLRTQTATEEWKYIEYPADLWLPSGEKELYDLVNDPYEEESKHDDPAYQDVILDLAARLDRLRGLNLTTWRVPKGQAGQAYTLQLSAWGGREPYTWTIVAGQLPAGLSLDRATGLISGTPMKAETHQVSIKIEDSSIAKHTGQPQSYIRELEIIVE